MSGIDSRKVMTHIQKSSDKGIRGLGLLLLRIWNVEKVDWRKVRDTALKLRSGRQLVSRMEKLPYFKEIQSGNYRNLIKGLSAASEKDLIWEWSKVERDLFDTIEEELLEYVGKQLRESRTASLVAERVAALRKAGSGVIVIATNTSTWAWEYDSHIVTAMVSLNERNGALSYELLHEHTKSGIGAGTRESIVASGNAGTVIKPNFSGLKNSMRQYGYKNSRSGSSFNRQWRDPITRREAPLSKLIAAHAATAVDPRVERSRKLDILKKSLGRLNERQLDDALAAIGVMASVSDRVASSYVRRFARFPRKAMDYNKVPDPDGFWDWTVNDANRAAGIRLATKNVGDLIFWLNMAASRWEDLQRKR